MSDLASYRTGIRARGIAVADISNDDLDTVLTEALSEFSRYRPLVADRTFDTIADQQVYTWTEAGDADGLMALLIIWNPYQSGGEWDLARTIATLGISQDAGYWHMPSQDLLEQAKSAAQKQSYGGGGYQIDPEGGDIYLTPTPGDAGDSVYLLYTKAHSVVTTVKSSDRDMYLDLVEAMLSDRIAKELGNKAAAVRIKTPEYEIQVGEKIGLWRKNGRECRDRFICKAQAGFSAAGRS